MFLRAKENNLPSDPSTIQALKMAASRNLDLIKFLFSKWPLAAILNFVKKGDFSFGALIQKVDDQPTYFATI